MHALVVVDDAVDGDRVRDRDVGLVRRQRPRQAAGRLGDAGQHVGERLGPLLAAEPRPHDAGHLVEPGQEDRGTGVHDDDRVRVRGERRLDQLVLRAGQARGSCGRSPRTRSPRWSRRRRSRGRPQRRPRRRPPAARRATCPACGAPARRARSSRSRPGARPGPGRRSRRWSARSRRSPSVAGGGWFTLESRMTSAPTTVSLVESTCPPTEMTCLPTVPTPTSCRPGSSSRTVVRMRSAVAGPGTSRSQPSHSVTSAVASTAPSASSSSPWAPTWPSGVVQRPARSSAGGSRRETAPACRSTSTGPPDRPKASASAS